MPSDRFDRGGVMAELHRRDARPQPPGARVSGPGDVRASDAERNQVVELLQQHYVDGRISAEELSERTDHIFSARTRGALEEVLADLPPLPHPDAARQAAPAPPRRRVPVAAIVVGVIATLLLLRMVMLLLGVGEFDGDFDGVGFVPFPLVPFLFMWIAFRAGRARS